MTDTTPTPYENDQEPESGGPSITNEERDTMERRELSGPGWTPRQSALYDVLEQVAEVFGPFDTGTGPDGIHYMSAADNPFAAEGIRCAGCAFFVGGGGCELVSDEVRVEPDAVCKFWIVQEDDLAAPAEEMTEDAGYGMKDDEDEDRIVVRRDLVEFAELRDRLAGEARSLDVTVTEARAIPADDGGYVIEGHAAVFDSNSYPLPDGRGSYFIEQVKRGAFRRALQNPEGPTVALINHDPNLILASTGSTPPTLELWEDPKGLRIRAHVAPTSYAEDLRVLMERGDVSGMSFGFTVEADRWWQDGEGRTRRDIQRIGRLTDISVVVSPAYGAPSAGITSREADEPHEEATASESATGGPLAAASASTRRRRLELIERETARNPIRKEP
jgi:HK97 family phage prohead protease